MGKKVDLNARRLNNNRIPKNNHNFNHYNNATGLLSEDNSSSLNEENQSNSGLGTSSLKRNYDLPKNANIIIKFPSNIKIALTAGIIGLPIFALMLFVVIFNEEDSDESASGLYTFGQTCEKVSVIDTENYRYDEEVSSDEYLEGVVAAESDGNTNLEYLKLLAIYARTYFFENASSSCEVEGNDNFQKYIDVDNSSNSKLVKQAVKETKDLVITSDDELLEIDYSIGCLVNKDSDHYYIRYIESLSGTEKYQQIPQNWASKTGVKTELDNLYEKLDKSESDYQNRICPENTKDSGLSKIGALYLISNKNYDYQEVIQYYNGNEVEITKNEKKYSGNGEFINPISTIYCSSPYGERTSPTTGKLSFHSGIDIAISQGTPIYAAKDGKVANVVKNVTAINNCNYSYGNYVIIDHGDGISTLYGHMKYGSIPDSISIGTSISQGEQIGQVGSTGCSTGYHLHYEVRENGSAIDPADYLDLTDASGNCQR